MNDTSESRYAVYYAPPSNSGLWQLAQRWLGHDCESGKSLEPPALDGWNAADISEVTQSPRRYGFHATLKAPFRLAPGYTLDDLYDALGAFAARQRPFLAPALKVSAIGPFLALTLSSPSPAVQALADAAVKELAPLRAPLSDGELQRRLAGDLTPRQQALLRSWGYPYVLDQFRFHMTLTGPITDDSRREALQTKLAALFRPVLTEPVPVGEVCLYSQDSKETPFRLVERFGFGAGASATTHGRTDNMQGPALS